MRKTIFIMTVLLSGLLFSSCQEEIRIGDDIDESAYGNIGVLNGYLRDADTNMSENRVTLYNDNSFGTTLDFGLNRAPGKGVDITLRYDESYLETFNAKHGTDFSLYPETGISISDGGRILIAPDEKLSSYSIDMVISPFEGIEEGKTYIVPVKAETSTDGVEIPSGVKHCVYMVNYIAAEPIVSKAPDAPKTFMFFETGATNPMNALELVMEDGSLFIDYLVLFAANMKYNSDTGEIYTAFNPDTQWLMSHNEELVQPLRKRGIKVILGILGTQGEVCGPAQLSTIGAKQYAANLAAVCRSYNLDGVLFDDEWMSGPDLSNPLLTTRSKTAAARLMYETKCAMPEKLVTVYHLNQMFGKEAEYVDGVPASEFIDIIVGDYGMTGYIGDFGGLTKKNSSGVSLELNRRPTMGGEGDANKVISEGFGYFMMFAPFAGNNETVNKTSTKWREQINTMDRVAKGLYGQELRPMEYFWDKRDLEHKEIYF